MFLLQAIQFALSNFSLSGNKNDNALSFEDIVFSFVDVMFLSQVSC